MKEIGYSEKALKPLKRWLLLSLSLTPLLVSAVNKASDLDVALPHLFEARFKKHPSPSFIAGQSESKDIFIDVKKELTSITDAYLKLIGREDFTLFCQPLIAKSRLCAIDAPLPKQVRARLNSATRFNALIDALLIKATEKPLGAKGIDIIATKHLVAPLIATSPQSLPFTVSSDLDHSLETGFLASFVKSSELSADHYRLVAEFGGFKQIPKLPSLPIKVKGSSFLIRVAKAHSEKSHCLPAISINHRKLYSVELNQAPLPSFDAGEHESFIAASRDRIPERLFSVTSVDGASAIDVFSSFATLLNEQTGQTLTPTSWVCFAKVEDLAFNEASLPIPTMCIRKNSLTPLYVETLPFKKAGSFWKAPLVEARVFKGLDQPMPYYYIAGLESTKEDEAQRATYIDSHLKTLQLNTYLVRVPSKEVDVALPVSSDMVYKTGHGLQPKTVHVAITRYRGSHELPSFNSEVVALTKAHERVASDAELTLDQVVVSAFGVEGGNYRAKNSQVLATQDVLYKNSPSSSYALVDVELPRQKVPTSIPTLVAEEISDKTPLLWVATPKEISFGKRVHDVFPMHSYTLSHMQPKQQLQGNEYIGIKQSSSIFNREDMDLKVASRSTKWASSIYEKGSYAPHIQEDPYIVAGPVESGHVPIYLEKSSSYLSIPGSFALFEKAPYKAPAIVALPASRRVKALEVSKTSKAPAIDLTPLLNKSLVSTGMPALLAYQEPSSNSVETNLPKPPSLTLPAKTCLKFSSMDPMLIKPVAKSYGGPLHVAFMKLSSSGAKELPPVMPLYRMGGTLQTYAPLLHENLFIKKQRDVIHLVQAKGLTAPRQAAFLVYSPELLTAQDFTHQKPHSIYVPVETLGDRISVAWLEPGKMRQEEPLYVDVGAHVSSPKFEWQLGSTRLSSYHSAAEQLIAAYKKDIAKSFSLSTPGFFFHEGDVVLANRYISDMNFKQEQLIFYMQDHLDYEHIHLNDSYNCDVQYTFNDQTQLYEFEIALTPKVRANHPKTPQNFIFIIDNSADVNSQRFAGFKKGITKSLAYIDPSDSIALIHASKDFTAPFNEPVLASGETKSYLSSFVNGLKYSGYYSRKTLPNMIEHASEFFVRGRENVVIVLSESRPFNNVRSLQHFMRNFSEKQNHNFAIYAATCRAKQGLEGAKLVTELHQGSFCNSPSVASFPRNLALMVKHACHTVSSHLEISLDDANSDNVTIYPSMLSSTLFSDQPFKLYGAAKDLTAFAIDIKAHSRDALLSLPLYIDLASAKENNHTLMYQTLEKQKALSFLHTAYYSDDEIFLECFDSMVKNGSLNPSSPLVFR